MTNTTEIHPAISEYIKENFNKENSAFNAGMLSYVTNLAQVASVSPISAKSIVSELRDQRENIKLIASENYCSLPTQSAMANLFTDKYAEGYSGHRFYAGCDNVDTIEAEASEEACKLFNCDHAYVQPHSGADANMIAFWAILHTRLTPKLTSKFGDKKLGDLTRDEWNQLRNELGNQKLLALDYYSGGHLTHGYRFNVSAQMFDAYSYAVSKETGLLDYDEIEKQALEVKPLILLAGYSAYPRKVNFKRMREIADKVGAVFMVDMAHFAGLVAGGVFTGDFSPFPHAHVVTSTTHKTLRGPRGGIILCTEEFREQVDKGCPLIIGGPLPHVIAAKAVAFREARSQEFKNYTDKIVKNCQALSAACIEEGLEICSGGSDNHLALIDVRKHGINGKQAEVAVRSVGITLNRNSLPFDPNGAWFTSGLRIGTPAITTLGMGTPEMEEIAKIIKIVLTNSKPAILSKGKNAGKPSKSKVVIDEAAKKEATQRVKDLISKFPVYPELNLEFLTKHFC